MIGTWHSPIHTTPHHPLPGSFHCGHDCPSWGLPFQAWRQTYLGQILPALVGATPGVGGATSQIATLLEDLLNTQCGQCSDTQSACTAASQPKTMSKFFNIHLTEKPLFLCNIALTYNLPDIWIELAAGNGKREHETIETCIWVVATGLGDTHLAPVIALNLSKKIVGVRLVGNNLEFFLQRQPFPHGGTGLPPPEPKSSTSMHSHWPETTTCFWEVQWQQNCLMFAECALLSRCGFLMLKLACISCCKDSTFSWPHYSNPVTGLYWNSAISTSSS